MDKALAAELERTKQEFKPDPEGFQRGLRRVQRRTGLLARRLLEPMRRGLTDEARLVLLAGLDRKVFWSRGAPFPLDLQLSGNALFQLFVNARSDNSKRVGSSAAALSEARDQRRIA